MKKNVARNSLGESDPWFVGRLEGPKRAVAQNLQQKYNGWRCKKNIDFINRTKETVALQVPASDKAHGGVWSREYAKRVNVNYPTFGDQNKITKRYLPRDARAPCEMQHAKNKMTPKGSLSLHSCIIRCLMEKCSRIHGKILQRNKE